MHVLKCIIVDDEPLPLQLLADYVKKTPFLELVGTYNNPLDALNAVQQQQVDLVFLDIQMPELTGIAFTELVGDKCSIIFTTAYRNFALEGYELNVVDYLLKPIAFDRFLKAAGKALQLISPAPAMATAAIPATPVLFVKSDYKLVKICVPDILYIEGLKEYIAIHTMTGKVVTLQNIKKMEAVLPAAQFARVHRSFIVALNKIDTIERNMIHIKNDVIPIGELYKAAFMKQISGSSL
ncbi:response regulator transcription factor [Chitinophaga polysaccharea]|uniref:LytR/AlgR family response regulator transcription factor n=1 Tax=Chitinophaga TaxID=79328 RepID=UPI001455BB39|nr:MULTISPECIES: LytTR family DNA-binding domain-containing protein [Chitinophaga]NLR61470.1 response regulator transcription factor [Chitinophaga polysaccharea]NLU95307.1 response regulator transcription factor [Chitinophaga sp. Ak27]